MNPHLFRFKQFSVVQEKSAMKIGTDGVLLSAWAAAENPQKILDIGTGTGLISLMLAQRFPHAEISGIEIDENAFSEAKFNIGESIFKQRCKVFHSSLQEFRTTEKFDLIVSNPPFFELTNNLNSSRNTARQQSDLTFMELIFYVEKLMASNGKFSVIIPYGSEAYFINSASKLNLYPERITRVKGNENAHFKRSLMTFSRKILNVDINELIIEISRNNYTSDYISLTRDFYLKM